MWKVNATGKIEKFLGARVLMDFGKRITDGKDFNSTTNGNL